MFLKLDTFFNIRSVTTRFFIFLTVFAGASTLNLILSQNAHGSDFFIERLLLIGGTTAVAIYVMQNNATLRKIGTSAINPFNAFISATIACLIIDPSTAWYIVPITIIAIMIGKSIRLQGKPVFNPAAFGLAATYYLFLLMSKAGLTDSVLAISWWGADLRFEALHNQPLVYTLTAAVFLYGFIYYAVAVKKQLLVGSFFMTTMMIVFYLNLTNGGSSVPTIRFLIESLFGVTAFMALVMIAEPKTSPTPMKRQILVGVLGGLLFFILALDPARRVSIDLPLLTTILGMNGITTALRRFYP